MQYVINGVADGENLTVNDHLHLRVVSTRRNSDGVQVVHLEDVPQAKPLRDAANAVAQAASRGVNASPAMLTLAAIKALLAIAHELHTANQLTAQR